MSEILPVTFLVQALSISCLKGAISQLLSFLPPCTLVSPPIPIHQHSSSPNASTQLHRAIPRPSVLSTASKHLKPPTIDSPSLLPAHTVQPLADLPTNHVLSVVWAQAIPGMPFISFSTLNTFFPFRLI